MNKKFNKVNVNETMIDDIMKEIDEYEDLIFNGEDEDEDEDEDVDVE